MSFELRDLHAKYLDAARFFNARVSERHQSDATRALLCLKALSGIEFDTWWRHVSSRPEIQARWLARLENPAQTFAYECQRISDVFDSIPLRRAAA